MKYEAVIGLEVHAQLMTKSKMFCSCPNEFGARVNENVCPICTGQPGTLPVINKKALELGVRAALAIGAEIREQSIFARKNYFYADLPKGYQITQYEKPFCEHGSMMVKDKEGKDKKIGITRIHFEEDAGKSTHRADATSVNLNRAGVPLVEIVSEPEIRNSAEAGQYLRQLRNVLRYIDVCDGNMEQGNFRCDANISVRPEGQKEFGTRVELKNINSFRFVEKAIDYEIERQIALIEQGGSVKQQTRSWDSNKNISEIMREKEDAHDYRYFPDPDLPVVKIDPKWVAQIKSDLPELPNVKKERFMKDYALSDEDAILMVGSKDLAEYFEAVTEISGNPKLATNWVANELLGKLHGENIEIEKSPVSAENLGDLLLRIESGEISGKIGKTVFEQMFESGREPGTIIKEEGLAQISDASQLEAIVTEVIAKNPSQVAGYKAGKTKLMSFFVGQVMKLTKGQANPKLVNELIEKALK